MMTPETLSHRQALNAIPTHFNKDFGAAFLSYLVPGLGQLVQGRVGKALLFFVGVYGLFFYGMALGQWSNVYFPDAESRAHLRLKLGGFPAPYVMNNMYFRPQFVGQFWVGVAAWPAIYHYWNDPPVNSMEHKKLAEDMANAPWWKRFQFAYPEEQLNRLQRDGDKRWDLGWVYTVIAGVLNVLVIYDALAGPALVNNEHTGGPLV